MTLLCKDYSPVLHWQSLVRQVSVPFSLLINKHGRHGFSHWRKGCGGALTAAMVGRGAVVYETEMQGSKAIERARCGRRACDPFLWLVLPKFVMFLPPPPPPPPLRNTLYPFLEVVIIQRHLGFGLHRIILEFVLRSLFHEITDVKMIAASWRNHT